MENIDKILYSLSKSKFRSSFHLKEKDKEYIKDKGMDKIREHAKDFITKRHSIFYIIYMHHIWCTNAFFTHRKIPLFHQECRQELCKCHQ